MSADLYPVPQNYGIDRWGEGYFGINPQGRATVCPDPATDLQIDIYRLAHEVGGQGLSWPVLIRFTDILHDRVRTLCQSFASVCNELDYRGRYTAIYPIKVNQQRSVVDEILSGGFGSVGLEAGSKPELMAVLAHSPQGGVIVCNGYKDAAYVRMALIGQRFGHRIFIVLEKPSELTLVLKEAASLQVEPLLGMRVRLSSSAAGNWQNSGGEGSKFGLGAAQVLDLVTELRQAGRLDRLQLLHSHIGSQISNLRDIRRGMGEVARFYGELQCLGADIRVVDVGGGLGVDYEGTRTRHYSSINYSQNGYAREVVKALHRICSEQNLPHPELFSESGRALTAHHAVLITNVIESDPVLPQPGQPLLPLSAPEVIRVLAEEMRRAEQEPPSEVYQEALQGLEESRELFEQGELNLEQRALAEQLFIAICGRLQPRLRPGSRRDRELLDRLHERLADRMFCNFSLFQSLPDVWAIDQIFPAMPLHRLNEQPSRSAVLHDLTCDSDGCIERYVNQEGVESTLPVHALVPGEPYLMGIFLVGAYQEILGDMHNLFGDTDAVNIELDREGGYRFTHVERGNSVQELLRYVHFSPQQMLQRYREKLSQARLDAEVSHDLFVELERGLEGYTYLGASP